MDGKCMSRAAMMVFGAFVSSLVVISCGEAASTATPTSAPRAVGDLVGAQATLVSYFQLLQSGRYSEAANHYGGDYDILRSWNPTVAEGDYAALFENGCTINGLACLGVKPPVVREEEISPTEFRFVVEFLNDDGSLFEVASQTQFPFVVKKVDGQFLVQDLPVYVP